MLALAVKKLPEGLAWTYQLSSRATAKALLRAYATTVRGLKNNDSQAYGRFRGGQMCSND
jgi:hypothetical protein